MALSKTIDEVIALATAIRDYWEEELPRRHPDYPLVHPGEDSGPPPPEEKKLEDLLDPLPDEDIYKLVLLMHLGRGDFGVDDLANSYENLKDRFGNSERAIAQMMQKPALADYLTNGLDLLNHHGIDLEQLSFSSANFPG